jgi:hypothetical protein
MPLVTDANSLNTQNGDISILASLPFGQNLVALSWKYRGIRTQQYAYMWRERERERTGV